MSFERCARGFMTAIIQDTTQDHVPQIIGMLTPPDPEIRAELLEALEKITEEGVDTARKELDRELRKPLTHSQQCLDFKQMNGRHKCSLLVTEGCEQNAAAIHHCERVLERAKDAKMLCADAKAHQGPAAVPHSARRNAIA